jgi:D-beta-D-heptose 7-phosphate kinase/D-beta-D-heptose 1-phosphate adenosyltransferase
MAANVSLNIKALGAEAILVTNSEVIIKERIVDARYGQQILRVDIHDQCESLTMEFVDLALEEETYDATVISDYNKGFLSAAMIREILPKLPGPIFVDSKKTDLTPYEKCIIKINEKESREISALPSDHQLIVTMGGKGAVFGDKYFPAGETPVFDVCGAGDTFLAALAVRYLQTQGDMSSSIVYANIAAGISVRHMGVYNVSLEEVEREVCV